MNRQVSIAFLRDQIGVSNAQLRNKLLDEGVAYDTIADFVEEDIQSLCSSVRRPGGQITDAQGNQVRDAGIAVPFLVEKRLKIACYAARYYKLVGRPIDATSMTWQLISQFEPFKEMQDEHSDPEDLPPVSKSLPILKWMEVFESYLQNSLGVSKVPLAYVTRAVADVENIAENPLLAQNPKPFGRKYGSFYEEMIGRVSHELPFFDADNRTVLELLVKSFKEYPSLMSSIRPHQKRGDGRAALAAVVLHNMGNTKWDDMVEKAMAKITKAVWNGRNARYSLIKHIGDHRAAFNDIVKAADNIEYAVMNERTRVTYLLDSIQCNHQQLVAAKTAILSDEAKRTNFELAADFLLLNAKSFKSNQSETSYNISAVTQGKSNDVELRYYKKKEYAKLSKEQKDKLRQLRKSKKDNDSSSQKNQDQTISSLVSKVEQLEALLGRTISAIESRDDDEVQSSSNERKRVRFNNLTQRS